MNMPHVTAASSTLRPTDARAARNAYIQCSSGVQPKCPAGVTRPAHDTLRVRGGDVTCYYTRCSVLPTQPIHMPLYSPATEHMPTTRRCACIPPQCTACLAHPRVRHQPLIDSGCQSSRLKVNPRQQHHPKECGTAAHAHNQPLHL